MKNKIPKYIDCKNNETHCEYYITRGCPQTCPYHFEVMGLGTGAADVGLAEQINKEFDAQAEYFK